MAAGSSIHFIVVTFRMLGGFLIWAAHFGVIYGLNGLACARGFAETQWLGIGVVSWGIAVATVAALVPTVWLTVEAIRNTRDLDVNRDANAHFIEWMTAGVGLAAILGILWDALPVLIVPPCA